MAELRVVGSGVGPDVLHAVDPNRQKHRWGRRFRDQTTNAPLDANRRGRHFALGEHVHPAVLRQRFDAVVDALLENSGTSHARHTASSREEPANTRISC